MKLRSVFSLAIFFLCLQSGFAMEQKAEPAKAKVKLDKVEMDWGFSYFRLNGYRDSLEPRVAFIKRKSRYSEVIEYSWRPMEIYAMPHKERIDRIRCLFNRYYFSGPRKLIFYGFGVGGNIVLFNDRLKDWAKTRGISLRDGVLGTGRLFVGYKLRDFTFLKKTYPVVVRVDGHFSQDYKFGGELGRAGTRLDLSEIRLGLNFSIE